MNKFTYKIKVFGCQMNKNDAQRVNNYLQQLGGKSVKDEAKADLLVLVACSVRQSAVDRLFGLAQKWHKDFKHDFKTILTGCVSDKDKNKFEEKFDYVLPIDSLPSWHLYLKNEFTDLNDFTKVEDNYFGILPSTEKKFSAFVPIMTGCNNFCSYCIVPYVRGRERSRKVVDVLKEIKYLVKKGAKEIVLLGQNVNSYDPQDVDNFFDNNIYKESAFAKLLWEVNQIEGVERLHFTSAHPKDMHDEVIDALTLPKHLNFLHLALQSGSDKVLQRMNRRYTVEDYKKIIKKVRSKKPEIALGTDIIVGFCEETAAEFQKTVDIYKEIEFDISYTSKYSNRKGTMAAKNLKDNVSLSEKKKRWRILQNLMEKIAKEKNKKYQDQEISVLFESYKADKKYLIGNSREMKHVIIKNVASDDLVGEIKKVKVLDTSTWVLWGKIIS